MPFEDPCPLRGTGQAALPRLGIEQRGAPGSGRSTPSGRRIGGRGKAGRPDPPRPRSGGRHHRQRRDYFAAASLAMAQRRRRPRLRLLPSSGPSANGSATWCTARTTRSSSTPCLQAVAARRKTLATAEASPAAWSAHLLVTVPGAARWFVGGVVAYTTPSRWPCSPCRKH